MKNFILPEIFTLKKNWEQFQKQFEQDLVEGTEKYRDCQRIFYAGMLGGSNLMFIASKQSDFPSSQIIAFTAAEFNAYIKEEMEKVIIES